MSYIKCESGNLPARIYCPPDQVFSKYTLNCEEESQCGSMYVRGDDKWPNPIPLAKIRHRFEEDAILDRNKDLEYSKDTSASQTTPDEMMPGPKYCPHDQVCDKYTLNCQEEGQCRNMYVQGDDKWTNPIPLAKILHLFEELVVLYRNKDLEYSEDISATENTLDEILNFLDKFLLSLLRIFDIEEQE
ncbi:hypothetical protein AVEN_156416-1 [Araneus ventricosus]|uniref:Chitin-binding type-2 domain-containing protein n=1 Tax=Araneus ventricosus TaxID=182803 RepID=A0A4Y2VBU9_ARAVE|nr:hypothetical protein AVEN_156416-1 [Araneus ventricosus]